MDLEQLVVSLIADNSQFQMAMDAAEAQFGRVGRRMVSDALAIHAGTSKHFESVRTEITRVTQALRDLQNQMQSTASTSSRTNGGAGRISLPTVPNAAGGPTQAAIDSLARRDIRSGNRFQNSVDQAAADALNRDRKMVNRLQQNADKEIQAEAERVQKMLDAAGKATYEARFKAAKSQQKATQRELDDLQRLQDAAGKATYDLRFRAARATQRAVQKEAEELQKLQDAAGKATYEARFAAARAAQRTARRDQATLDRSVRRYVGRDYEAENRHRRRQAREATNAINRRRLMVERRRRERAQEAQREAMSNASARRRTRIVSSLAGGMIGRLSGGAVGGIAGALGGMVAGPIGAAIGVVSGTALKAAIDVATLSARTFVSVLQEAADVGLKIASYAVKVGVEYEKASIAFKVFAGGKEQGGALLKQIQQLAIATPFKSNELQLAAQQLMSFGVGSGEVMPALGKLTAVSMGDLNRLNHLVKAYGDVVAHGKFLATELRQFSNTGIGPADFAKANNMTEADFLAKMHRGEATVNMMRAGVNLAGGPGGRFGKVNEELNQTVSGQVNALVESIDMRLGDVMTRVFKKLDVSGKINEIVGSINSINMESVVAWFEKFSEIATTVWNTVKAIVVSMGQFFGETLGLNDSWEEVGKKVERFILRVIPQVASFGQFFGKIMIDVTTKVVEAFGIIGAMIVDANNLGYALGITEKKMDRNAPLLAAAGVTKGLDVLRGTLEGPNFGKIVENNLNAAMNGNLNLPGAKKADTGMPDAAKANIKLLNELFGSKTVDFANNFKEHMEKGLTPLEKFEEQMKIIGQASTVPEKAPAGTAPLLNQQQAQLAYADAFKNLLASGEGKRLTEARLAPAAKINTQEARDVANQAGMVNEQIKIAANQLLELQQIRDAAKVQAAETAKLGKALADMAANQRFDGGNQKVIGVGFGPQEK